MNEQGIMPKVISQRKLIDEFVQVTKDDLVWPDGTQKPYYSVSTTKNSVAVIAIDHDFKILTIQEYRHPTKTYLLSCPAGVLAQGEDPIQGAKRELSEETGYTAATWHILGTCYPLPGIFDQKLTIVLAQNAHKVHEPILESSELITHTSYTHDEILQKIHAREEVDGIFCTALFYMLTFKKA